jgi:hypothetical protein
MTLMRRTFIISSRNQNTAGFNLQLASNFGSSRVGPASGTPAVHTAEVQAWMESILAPMGLWDDVAPE